ncbi:hypothetical protein O181_112619 [Austropuccinia psidii MF-1]|uniref:Uncharacterized protein n=1 Tax=Austropuccinia psidii MF-1 TaxID=1389203 RepID=A0A9Q3K4A6_9BASI|nr:hypothetical protein [Austropuccinia psidii MF-1]
MPSTRSGTSYNSSSSSQKGNQCDYGRIQSVTEGQGADTATRSLGEHLTSQPEGLQQCTSIQGVPDTCRSVEKLHEFLPDCEKIPGPSQQLQVTQLMASIDGKEENDSLNIRMEEKQPSTSQTSAKNSPSGQQQNFQCEKEATSSEQGKRKGTSH